MEAWRREVTSSSFLFFFYSEKEWLTNELVSFPAPTSKAGKNLTPRLSSQHRKNKVGAGW
jgi:hypothetical protein